MLFPGQGSHGLPMLDALVLLPGFAKRYELLCKHLDFDPVDFVRKKDPGAINSNLISSALTVLASVLALDEYRRVNSEKPEFVSGYSVGQWTALYAAGVISYEKLIEVVVHRARLMDKCSDARPGGMLAVIGLAPEPLISLCHELSSAEKIISISNYNCYGQYTLSGDLALIQVAQEEIAKLSPKKLAAIPVSGAWHSPILADAAAEFENYLQTCSFSAATAKVVDNVSGEYLDTGDTKVMLETLAKQVSHPVQWHKGMKLLIADAANEFVEIGYGNTLTKFGMFIDRSVEHKAFFPSPVNV